MEVESILAGSQTYIGVLATFIVLCLFISKNSQESNFIIYTILKVGEDFKNHLRTHVEEIKDEIRSQSDNRNVSDILGESNTTSATAEGAPQSDLFKNMVNTMMVTQRFFNNVARLSGEFKPDQHLRDKEELPYIALLCLLLIITTMLTDCIGFIATPTRCMFLSLLLCTSTIFISVLYSKFFKDYKTEDSEAQDSINAEKRLKPSKCTILAGLVILLLAWFFIAPFITSPAISLITLALIQMLGGYAIKRKWVHLSNKHNRYNRFMILKHYACFIIYIACITAALSYWHRIMPYIGFDQHHCSNWTMTVSLMHSQTFCYYIILAFFSFNTIFGPILAGALYLKHKENSIIKVIRKQQKEIQPIIAELTQEYRRIILKR